MPYAPQKRTKPRAPRLYDRKDWRDMSKRWLDEHPLCVECKKNNKITPAQVVDHIIPHRGNWDLFWDSDHNWAGLCPSCHSIKTRQGL